MCSFQDTKSHIKIIFTGNLTKLIEKKKQTKIILKYDLRHDNTKPFLLCTIKNYWNMSHSFSSSGLVQGNAETQKGNLFSKNALFIFIMYLQKN